MGRPREHSDVVKEFKGVTYTMTENGDLHILSSGTDITLDASEVRALRDLLQWTAGRWME